MTIRLRCLECGHSVDLGEAYEDYAGEVRCVACRTVLDVALKEGRLKAMRLVGAAVAPCSTDRGGGPEPLAPATAASQAGHETT